MIVIYCSGFCPSLFYMVSALLLRSSNPGGTTAKRTREGSLFVIDYGTSWAYGYTVARDSGSPAKGIAYAKIATY